MTITPSPVAIHLPGGNHFDDVRIDIDRSIAGLAAWNLQRPKAVTRNRTALANRLRLYLDMALQNSRWGEIFVSTGLRRDWFDEFLDYWNNVVRGRPLTVSDFLLLQYDYRKKNQLTKEMDWSTPHRHVANWQDAAQIYYIFHFVRKCALSPVRIPEIGKLLRPNSRVLEYGCSLAPAFRDYRAHHMHLGCRWVLADIPNYAFHYSMYAYGAQPDIEAIVPITADKFRDPLRDVAGGFDFIVVQEVLEHLDDPYFVVEYLLNRLNRNGRILFDFIRSDGKGLDTPRALELRRATLQLIADRLDIESGRFEVDGGDLGQCIGRLKA